MLPSDFVPSRHKLSDTQAYPGPRTKQAALLAQANLFVFLTTILSQVNTD